MGETSQENTAIKLIIKMSGVSKAFSTKTVLKNIDLEILPRQSVCLCGVNGAGKSTLLRITAGLLQPDVGNVKICEYDVKTDPEKSKPQIGVISHKSMVYPNLTALENLCFFANLYGVKDSTSRVDTLLHDVGLFSYRYDRAGTLSRGLLQRLAIARALVHRPSVLLADEPFTGLDTEACKHLISVLTDFTNNGGTVMFTTHDISIGLKCCDRVVVLDKSLLILDVMKSDIDTDSFAQDYLSYARGHN